MLKYAKITVCSNNISDCDFSEDVKMPVHVGLSNFWHKINHVLNFHFSTSIRPLCRENAFYVLVCQLSHIQTQCSSWTVISERKSWHCKNLVKNNNMETTTTTCRICKNATANNHNHYGSNSVCHSCRAFFMRSVKRYQV